MADKGFFYILLLFICSSFAQELVNDEGVPIVLDYLNLIRPMENETTPPEWFQRLPGYECSLHPRWPGETRFTFPCDEMAPSSTRPTSVHRLRPGDINVIGALGDSITAANGAGACFLPEVAYMYRGQCFSTGGDGSFEDNPTLANILRKYNPGLKGYSLETNWWTSPQAGMNVGIPGAVADDMPEQAHAIINAMKDDPNIDFENDWKLVTIFIGGNDLCGWCRRREQRTAELYTKWIQDALQILHDGLPRTYVAVAGILLVPEVDVMDKPLCKIMHQQFCSCGMDLSIRNEFWNITRDYQVTLQAMVESGIFDDKEDFTASLLPALHNTHMPRLPDGTPDYSYFSADCFHFSHKGHAGFGATLWNNMLERVGERTDSFVGDEPLLCPTSFPYLYTNVNSEPGFQIEEPSAAEKPVALSLLVLIVMTLLQIMLV